MLHFENDYNEGIHPELLQRLIETNSENLSGYGTDPYTKQAADKIRLACHAPEAKVFFLTGGTQTNQIAIASLLVAHEGVIAAETGHINTHEAGAIEHTGHKVLTLPHHQGKLTAETVSTYLADYEADSNKTHTVAPGMIYISHPTEYGTLYSRAELEALATVARQYQLPLFLDGARLSYGLAAETDVDLPTIANLCDVFYIGGTKIGAIAGEALVYTDRCPKHFTSFIKQHGALLAKGRLYGIQFDQLFTDDLHLNIGKHAVSLAMQLKQALLTAGYQLYIDSPTNQQFVLLTKEQLVHWQQQIVCSVWGKFDETYTIVRLATSWSTTQDDIDALVAFLNKNTLDS